MSRVNNETINELIELSRLLGEFGQIERATLMLGGDQESDSHHSFTLALIAFELASQYAPELDGRKILLYGLVHDLPELITGDVITLNASSDELDKKMAVDMRALAEFEARMSYAPHILEVVKAYELKSDDKSLFVYWVDKMVNIPTHFYDNGAHLRRMGIKNHADIQGWYERTLRKLHKHGRMPHMSAVMALELAYKKMYAELVRSE